MQRIQGIANHVILNTENNQNKQHMLTDPITWHFDPSKTCILKILIYINLHKNKII